MPEFLKRIGGRRVMLGGVLLGGFLKAAEKASGTAGLGRPKLGGTRTEPPKDTTPTLAAAGISWKLSAEAGVSERKIRRGRRYNRIKHREQSPSGQFVRKAETSEALAAQRGVTERTIRRAGKRAINFAYGARRQHKFRAGRLHPAGRKAHSQKRSRPVMRPDGP